ncbi:uncharacterized protein N7459_008423 [Penicillium hispanicum]|uniref:uncharacterized protein n=1 Tax=Penicillium hispanicum TaxID=1080232 RepID=UPI002541E31D|nr:uncharacterized protein N7459_008423 [Penicillium hispanicum]KAJ5573996.1 hypothetical protein N7459_008423 [Penicillium hispanicum]
MDYRRRAARAERVGKSDLRELVERASYMERILKRTIEGIRMDTKSLGMIADALDADRDGGNPVGSNVKDVEGLTIDDESCTMDPVGETTTHFSGEFSYWNFSMRIKHHIEKQIPGSEARISDSDHVSDFPRAHQLRSGHNHLAAAISCFPPRHIADFLARAFFKYTETHYFFVGELWLLEKLNLLYQNPGDFTTHGDEVIVSILLIVIAIGTQYAHLERAGEDPIPTTASFSEEEIGAAFYQQAIRLLPEIIELSSLESVQACLLFGLYALPVDASGLGYIYINLAIRLGMQNGMHRKGNNKAFSASMIETRNRVWWTAYLLERYIVHGEQTPFHALNQTRKISIFHGRPLSVLRSDVDASVPSCQMEPEMGASNSCIGRADASIQLIHFLEEFFDEVTVLRGCPKQQITKAITRLLSSKTALTQWWNSLSADVVNGRSQSPQDVRSSMHLRLEYCLVRMFVGRPFMLKRETSESDHGSPSHSEIGAANNRVVIDGAAQRYASGREDLINDSINAAIEALLICQELRDRGPGLARASYVEYSSCRVSLLVLIAYSIQSFSEQYRKPLYEGLDMIREMSAAGESARSEVALIETLERALARLHMGRRHAQDREGPSQSRSSVSSYEAFKNWGVNLRASETQDTSAFPAIASSAQAPTPGLPPGQPSTPGLHSHGYVPVADHGNATFAVAETEPDAGVLDSFDSFLGLSIFGAENSSPSAGWPTWTEAQVLEQFLADPQYGSQQDTSIGRY